MLAKASMLNETRKVIAFEEQPYASIPVALNFDSSNASDRGLQVDWNIMTNHICHIWPFASCNSLAEITLTAKMAVTVY